MDLTELALLAGSLKAQDRGDDRGGIDGPWQHTGKKDIGVDPVGLGEVIAQGLRLKPSELGEASASGSSTHHAVESGVGVTMADENEAHRRHGTQFVARSEPDAARWSVKATSTGSCRSAVQKNHAGWRKVAGRSRPNHRSRRGRTRSRRRDVRVRPSAQEEASV